MKRANRGLVSILVLIAVVATFGSSEPVRARAANSSLPATRTGATASSAAHHDQSQPLAQIAGARQQAQHTDHPAKAIPRHKTVNASVSGTSGPNPAPAIPATLGNFEGVGAGFAGPAGTFSVTSAPPDTNAAVGPNAIVEMVNTSFAIFNKSGTVVYGPVATNTIWSGFGGGCQSNNDGDGSARYDSIADRWVLEQFSVTTTPYLECVAVSVTSDPTGAYSRYSFQYTDFPDYPKISVWPDAYYVTFNKFAGGTTFSGGLACAYDRTRMLQGLPATQQCFDFGTSPTVCTTTPTLCYGGLLTADLDGSRLPPAGSPNYILALDTSSALAFWRFHVDWTTPASTTLTGPIAIPTASYAIPCGTSPTGTCIPQQGTNQQLDSLADRLMYRFAYRNFGDHEALVTNHTVIAGSGTGIRWYEIRTPGATPSLFQQGTYAPDNNFRWMGSVAMDQMGNIGLGFSLSSSSMHPAIHYTGRLVSDANGLMPQGEGTIINGAGSQTGTISRWGDYTSMAIDPTDDCTFWYANEYLAANGAFNWRTRLANFKFPGCAGPYIAGAVGTDNGLWVLPSGSQFAPEGGTLLGAPAIAAIHQNTGPAVALYVATGTDHTLWVRNDFKGWQIFASAPTYCIDNPAAVVIAETLYVACQGRDHALWHAEMPAPSSTDLPRLNPTSWQSLGGVLTAGPAVSNVAAKPTYFVIGTDQHVYARDSMSSDFTRSDWTCIGHPAVASFNSTSYFACHGTYGGLWYSTNTGAGWSTVQSLGGPLVDGVGLAATSAGPIFFVEGTNGTVWHRSISSDWALDGGLVHLGLAATAL